MLFDILKNLSTFSYEVNLNFNDDNLLQRGNIYYFKENYLLEKGEYLRIGNSFLFDFKNQDIKYYQPIFMKVNDQYYQPIVFVNNGYSYTNKIIGELVNIKIDNDTTLKNIVKRMYKINVSNELDNPIILQYLFGSSQSELARKFGISRQRVEQICKQYILISLVNLNKIFNKTFKIYKKCEKEILDWKNIILDKYNTDDIKVLILNINNSVKNSNYIPYIVKDNDIYFIFKSSFREFLGKYYVLYLKNRVIKLIDNNNLNTKVKCVFMVEHNGKRLIIEKNMINSSRYVYLHKNIIDSINKDLEIIKK